MQFIQPANLSPPAGPGSHAVLAGGWLYVSGMTARGAGGELVGRGDISAQAEQALQNLRACVETAGGTLLDVVKLNIYMKHAADYRPAVTAARLRHFGEHRPASTVVVAEMLNPDLLVEIEAVALIPTHPAGGSKE